MNEKHSLLNNIRSKYILKDILIYAFRNMKSVLKFVAYDKVLLNKLDINIKDYYDYKTIKIVEKKFCEIFYLIVLGNFFFIPLIIYNIRFFKKGKYFFVFSDAKDYKYKRDFIDLVDNYITTIFLVIELIYYIFLIIYYKNMKIILTKKIKFIIKIIHFFIYFVYYVIHFIKYSFTKELRKNLSPNYWNKDLEWFYTLDRKLALLWPFYLSYILIYSLVYLSSCFAEDIKSIILNQINGFDISDFELPLEFDDLNKMGKIEMIFKKANMKRYEYKLDDTQKILIDKIEQLKRKNNIRGFRNVSYHDNYHLPDYIINKKTELIFKEEKNIYKFSNNYYLIKYPISETQKEFNDENIIKIIKLDFFDSINIIRKDNYEYISLYKNSQNDNNSLFKTQLAEVQNYDRSENIIILNEKNINIFEKLRNKN